jgi:hypothetical protein
VVRGAEGRLRDKVGRLTAGGIGWVVLYIKEEYYIDT